MPNCHATSERNKWARPDRNADIVPPLTHSSPCFLLLPCCDAMLRSTQPMYPPPKMQMKMSMQTHMQLSRSRKVHPKINLKQRTRIPGQQNKTPGTFINVVTMQTHVVAITSCSSVSFQISNNDCYVVLSLVTTSYSLTAVRSTPLTLVSTL